MELFSVKILDVIDILLVAVLMYQLYKMIKGTSAFNISLGIFALYILWIIVRALNMELISMILGQIIGVGVIALIVVFQQEIRRFLIFASNKYFAGYGSSFRRSLISEEEWGYIDEIVTACENMSRTRTGALIVFARRNALNMVQETGDNISAKISHRLIETIFFKNSPLHDGAMLIVNQRIEAVRCVLPTTERVDVPPHLGMRHRAAIGLSEQTDAVVVVVSEQTGRLSYVESGKLYYDLNMIKLKEKLVKAF